MGKEKGYTYNIFEGRFQFHSFPIMYAEFAVHACVIFTSLSFISHKSLIKWPCRLIDFCSSNSINWFTSSTCFKITWKCSLPLCSVSYNWECELKEFVYLCELFNSFNTHKWRFYLRTCLHPWFSGTEKLMCDWLQYYRTWFLNFIIKHVIFNVKEINWNVFIKLF